MSKTIIRLRSLLNNIQYEDVKYPLWTKVELSMIKAIQQIGVYKGQKPNKLLYDIIMNGLQYEISMIEAEERVAKKWERK